MNYSTAPFNGEQLTANGVTLVNEFGWIALDLSKLWVPQWFWDNRTAPGVAGTLPFNAEEDQLAVQLPIWVVGSHFVDGTLYDNPQAGFWRNWQHLTENVWNGYIISCVYQPPDPDADEINFQAQFSAPDISERYPVDWKGTMQVILAGGAVRATGS